MTNTNPETGIRYTVIACQNLDPEVYDDLWMNGTNLSEEAAYEEVKAEIEQEVDDEIEAGEIDEDDREYEVERRLDRVEINVEEPTIEGESEGVKYHVSWLGGAPLLWVFESPHLGRFRLCSPCVPNACDGDSPDPDGYEGYDVPADWRRVES